MYFTLHKKLCWLIVVWFALMQIIAPLMHAHIEKDSPARGVGMHMHLQHFDQAVEKVATFKNAHDDSHVIGVEQAVVKDIQLTLLPVLAVLFFLLLLPVIRIHLKPATPCSTQLPFYLRPDSRPRAPPLF